MLQLHTRMNDTIDPRILERLNDIYASAGLILERLQDQTQESFVSGANSQVQDAIAYRFAIIGEASFVLLKKYPDFCAQHSDIPLRDSM